MSVHLHSQGKRSREGFHQAKRKTRLEGERRGAGEVRNGTSPCTKSVSFSELREQDVVCALNPGGTGCPEPRAQRKKLRQRC